MTMLDTCTITTLADRPEHIGRIYEVSKADTPEFLFADLTCNALLPRVPETFPETCIVATDADGRLVGRGRSVPLSFGRRGREHLPSCGANQMLVWSFADHAAGVEPDVACAMEISVDPDLRGEKLSYAILGHMREAVAARGLKALLCPVRPTAKHVDPTMAIEDYIAVSQDDGLPVDPWLRVHVRMGGHISGVAPSSSVIAGSLADWRRWTGLPFDRSGPVEVPGALVPVTCDVDRDMAVYVEPNVWVTHDLR